MIYLFYTATALATFVSIGTIWAQQRHINRLKKIYLNAVQEAKKTYKDYLDTRNVLRSTDDAKHTWARQAHQINNELTNNKQEHEQELENMRQRIYIAEQYMLKVRTQKRNYSQKKRNEKRNK